MFGKKKVEKTELPNKYREQSINGYELEGWLKMSGGKELIRWLENLENALMVGVFGKSIPFTKEELLFRQGEVSALRNLTSLIKEIRSIKKEDDKTEE